MGELSLGGMEADGQGSHMSAPGRAYLRLFDDRVSCPNLDPRTSITESLCQVCPNFGVKTYHGSHWSLRHRLTIDFMAELSHDD